MARFDLRGIPGVDPAVAYAQTSCPVGLFVDDHPSGGLRYTVGVNPASPPRSLRPALEALARAEFERGAPCGGPEPVPGNENWGGRETVFGSPWNYGSRLAPDQVVSILVEVLDG